MSSAVSGAVGWIKSWWGAAEPTPEETPAEKLSKKIKNDLTDFIYDGKKKILADPVKALIYSVAIKMLSLFVALVFPFIGYVTIGLSMAFIDAQVFINAKEFTDKLIDSIKDNLKKMRDKIWADDDGRAAAG
ncbi:MAG: hypothetical protein K940chlam1_01088 [Candidatus Anoxychlamydiales bacterium]|nr:hypothetical protein [Candidatus Anoxychlamydiales bacterium]NGX36431.1 hypothetical protein [Candidatus Anoxychlamydiales bacterium]